MAEAQALTVWTSDGRQITTIKKRRPDTLGAYLETLSRAGDLAPGTLPTYRDSLALWNDYRHADGIYEIAGEFLTGPSGNAKLSHTITPVVSLSLAPGASSGIEVCPDRGACTYGCVGSRYCGLATVYPRIPRVRENRTRFLHDHPQESLALIAGDLERYTHRIENRRRAGRRHIAARLNAFSDLRWEHIAPWLYDLPYVSRSYDYTKRADRAPEIAGGRYSLILSASERDTSETLRAKLATGPLAIVADVPRGYVWPREIAGLPLFGGDSDDRANATRGPGAVVGLVLKGTPKTRAHMRRTGFALTIAQWAERLGAL